MTNEGSVKHGTISERKAAPSMAEHCRAERAQAARGAPGTCPAALRGSEDAAHLVLCYQLQPAKLSLSGSVKKHNF